MDVSGNTVVVLADTPALMGDGNWRVGVVMDAAASPEQAEKLGAVFGGQLGGPMAMLSPLIGEMLGMESVPIDYVDDGRRRSVKVGEDGYRDRGLCRAGQSGRRSRAADRHVPPGQLHADDRQGDPLPRRGLWAFVL